MNSTYHSYRAKSFLDIFRNNSVIGLSAGAKFQEIIDKIGKDKFANQNDIIHSYGDMDIFLSEENKTLRFIGIYPGRTKKGKIQIDGISFEDGNWPTKLKLSTFLGYLVLNSISFYYFNNKDIYPYVKIIDVNHKAEVFFDGNEGEEFRLDRVILSSI